MDVPGLKRIIVCAIVNQLEGCDRLNTRLDERTSAFVKSLA